jgi:hypothetical protein
VGPIRRIFVGSSQIPALRHRHIIPVTAELGVIIGIFLVSISDRQGKDLRHLVSGPGYIIIKAITVPGIEINVILGSPGGQGNGAEEVSLSLRAASNRRI